MSHAELRLTRIMAGVIAVGGLIFFLLAFGDIIGQSSAAPPWWTAAATLAVFGAPIAVAGVLPFADLREARIALGIAATLYLVAAASAAVVLAPSTGAEAPPVPWVVNNTAASTSAAALAFPRVVAWGYNVAVSVAVAGVQAVVSRGTHVWPGIQDALYSFAFCAVFIALAQFTLFTARRLDRESVASSRAAQASAAAAARRAERTRVDALLHDTVLAALMLASRGGERVEPAVRRQARDAIAALDRERRGQPTADEALVAGDRLRTLLTRRLRSVHPEVTIDGDVPAVPVPATVVDVIAHAAAEAVRNSVRHSGRGGLPPALSFRRHDGLALEVGDDGVGFDPAAVPSSRLGIRQSIVARVEALPGGRASIDSAPGAGARVRLEWTRS